MDATQADTLDELMSEAQNLFLLKPESLTHVFAKPKKQKTSSAIKEVSLEPWVAVAVKIREVRPNRQLTQKEMAGSSLRPVKRLT